MIVLAVRPVDMILVGVVVPVPMRMIMVVPVLMRVARLGV